MTSYTCIQVQRTCKVHLSTSNILNTCKEPLTYRLLVDGPGSVSRSVVDREAQTSSSWGRWHSRGGWRTPGQELGRPLRSATPSADAASPHYQSFWISPLSSNLKINPSGYYSEIWQPLYSSSIELKNIPCIFWKFTFM